MLWDGSVIDWRKAEQKEKLLRNLGEWTGKNPEQRGTHALSATPVANMHPEVPKQCAKCHRWRLLTEMFECAKCGKNYCVEHQDPTSFLCPDCAAEAAKQAAAEEDACRNAMEEEGKREGKDHGQSRDDTLSRRGKGAVIGAAIGSIVPGIGTLLGGGIGAVVGGFKKRKCGEGVDMRDNQDEGKPAKRRP